MASSAAGRGRAGSPHRAAATALVLVALFPFASRAQSASDRDTARVLMQEGDARRDRKDLKGALESYQAADALMHVTTTGLEVARTLVQLGSLVEAHDKLVEVMRIPARASEPSALTAARAAAQALSEDLDGRIPGIRVVLQGLPPTGTATVSIDGATIPPAALIAYRRVNPGHHVVAVQVADRERREDVSVAEREKRDVTIDLGSGLSAVATPTASATGPASADRASAGSTVAQAGPWGALAVTGFSLGAAGLVAGSITGIVSISKANAAKGVPPSQGGCVADQCGPATHSDIDAANLTGNISTVAFILGGAGIALGVTSLLVRGGSSPQPGASGEHASPSMSVSPWLGPFGGGLRGTF